MNRFIGLLVAVLAACVLVPLGIANRHVVAVTLDPFARLESTLAYEMPMSLALFGVFLVGLMAGGLTMWLSQSRWRHAARLRTREAFHWKSEASRLTRERDDGAAKSLPVGRRAA